MKQRSTLYLLSLDKLLQVKSAKKTDIKRGLTYKVLDDLVEKGLVEKKEEEGKTTLFSPAHPMKLQDFVDSQHQKAKDAKSILQGALPELVSTFNLSSEKPGIKFYEGVSGLEKIYDDILSTGENTYVFRAVYEPDYHKNLQPIIERFVKKRAQKGIHTEIITPHDEFITMDFFDTDSETDKKLLKQRTLVPKEMYNTPVEIDIYGDKVAILSFGKELLGFIIESPQIAASLRMIFALSKLGGRSLAQQSQKTTSNFPKPGEKFKASQ